jgi:hypothetical protein
MHNHPLDYSLPSDEKSARALVKVIEEQAHHRALTENEVRALVGVLRFVPKGPYPEGYWPNAWVKAARLLVQDGQLRLLQELEDTGGFMYLSAVGAVALAEAGLRSPLVESYLTSIRDYPHMHLDELRRLESLLIDRPQTERPLHWLRQSIENKKE